MSEIENYLNDVTCDQIATHFDSYYRYLNAAVPLAGSVVKYINSINSYISDYVANNGVPPSLRAISLAFKYKSLNMFNGQDLRELIGDVDDAFIDPPN